MKLSALISATKTVSFEFNGGTIILEARTAALTPRLLAEAEAVVNSPDELKKAAQVGSVTAEMVNKLVASWDVVNDDETPYPLDVQALSDLPLGFLSAVVSAIQSSLGEVSAPESGATLDATSSPTAN